VDPHERTIELLEEIAKWSREAALPAAKARVVGLLDTETKLRVYDAISGGTLTVRKLEDAGLGVSRKTAQEMVDEWDAAGLLIPGANPPKALFSLAELGIVLPATPATRGRKPTTK
jgi:hypothetical protein